MRETVAQDPERKCLLCGGALTIVLSGVHDTRFGVAEAYDICRCLDCGLEQTHPLPSAKELKRLYEACYNFGGEEGTVYTRLREWFLSSRLYRLWLVLDGDVSFHAEEGTGRLIDIGCNEGRGLVLYRRNGFEVEGLEPNEPAAAAGRARGFTVHVEPLEDFHPGQLYDVAVLSNVLEHALEPKEILAHVRRILRPGGEVWITCPNAESWLRSVFGRCWINWHVPFHIVHFSAATLKPLVRSSGFGVISISQATPALWVAQSAIARLFAWPGRPTHQLRNPLLVMSLMLVARGLLGPLLWLGNRRGRGDCVVARARAA